MLSPFLIGQTFVRKHSWEYSANIVGSQLGKLLLREYSWGYSLNCDEDIFAVQKASLSMFWEYLPYLTKSSAILLAVVFLSRGWSLIMSLSAFSTTVEKETSNGHSQNTQYTLSRTCNIPRLLCRER